MIHPNLSSMPLLLTSHHEIGQEALDGLLIGSSHFEVCLLEERLLVS